jgi:hypothetical protein
VTAPCVCSMIRSVAAEGREIPYSTINSIRPLLTESTNPDVPVIVIARQKSRVKHLLHFAVITLGPDQINQRRTKGTKRLNQPFSFRGLAREAHSDCTEQLAIGPVENSKRALNLTLRVIPALNRTALNTDRISAGGRK